MSTCKIQWIDDDGKPTPDSNESVGFAVITRTYTRGPAAGSTVVERFPCCELHRVRGWEEGYFGNAESFDGVAFACRTVWSYEPAEPV